MRLFRSLLATVVFGLFPTAHAFATPADTHARLLIENALIFSPQVRQDGPFLGFMEVAGDGSISRLGHGKPPPVHANQRIDAQGFWLLPGFVSAHSHLWQSGFSGIAPNQGLRGWLDQLYGVEAKKLGARELYLLSQQGAWNHLNNGITSAFNFTYTGRDKSGLVDRCQLRGALDSGLRVVHGFNVRTIGANWTADQAYRRTAAFLNWARMQPERGLYLRTMLAGAAAYDGMPAEQMVVEARLMRELGLGNQQHYLESPRLAESEAARYEAFKQAGMIGPGMVFGHFIHSTPDIAADAAASGVAMSWNPLSNGRLGSGMADVLAYRKLGMKIGMGVDGEASADRADPFENMRMGLYQVRARAQDAAAMSAEEVWRMHTLGSAEVLGIDHLVGSLEPGKRADFMLLNPQEFSPYKDAYAALVFAAGVENIHSVYVDGVQVRQREPDASRISACSGAAPAGRRQAESAPPVPPAG